MVTTLLEEVLLLLAHQDIISIDLGLMPLREHMGTRLPLGGNHFLQNKPLIDLMLEGTLMILISMMTVHMG